MAESTEIKEVEERGLSFSESLTNQLNAIGNGLPRNFNISKFVNNCVYVMNNNDTVIDYIKKYPKTGVAQVKACMIRGAYVGLDFMSQECYLVPYKSKLDFMISYRGAVKLAKKYSVTPIKNIYAEVIRQGDLIKYGTKADGTQYLEFEPVALNEGEIIGAFAVCIYENGAFNYCVMTRAEIEKCKNASSNSGAVWKAWYSEQAKKSVLKRLCKNIQIEFDSTEMRKEFDYEGEMVEQNTEVPDFDLEDTETTEVFQECEVVNGEVEETKP